MNLVIIGAGPGGYPAAIRASQLGAKVTLIEKDKPGGTCLNWGCIPSKIMRRTADAAREAVESAVFGVEVNGSFNLNMTTLRTRQKSIVNGQISGLEKNFKALNINLVYGVASVEKEGQIKVAKNDGNTEFFDYDQLLLATGSVPATIPSLPIDGDKIISSDHALWMEEQPESLLVVGGGVIGCELAQIYQDYGSKVTLVEALPRLLPSPSVDEEISKVYMRCLKKNKLPYYTGFTLSEVKASGEKLAVTLKPFNGEGEAKELEVEKILVAIGRKAAFEEIGLEKLGVTLDHRGWVEADEQFRTKAPNVWAIGDCLGPNRVMLAHVATAEGLAAVENMFGQAKTVDYDKVPSAIFSHPEAASVGLTLAQAQEKYPDSKACDFLFRQLGKAQAMGEIDGLTRLIVAPDGRIVGGHIIGPCATSLIAEIALAVTNGLTADDLAQTIHAHPTLPEGIWEASMAAVGTPIHG